MSLTRKLLIPAVITGTTALILAGTTYYYLYVRHPHITFKTELIHHLYKLRLRKLGLLRTIEQPQVIDGVRSTHYTVEEGLTARVYVEDEERRRPVVCFCHGGGFALFSARSREYDALAKRMAKLFHCVVIAPEYVCVMLVVM